MQAKASHPSSAFASWDTEVAPAPGLREDSYVVSKRSSAAHRALGFLVPDRWREMREQQEQVASTPRLAAAMMSSIAKLEAMGSSAHGDFVAKGLTEGAAPVLEAMASIAGENLQRTPDKLVFSSVPDDETVAAMSVHPDGSGAILLSDSLASLLDYFAGLTICIADKAAEETVAIATVSVRYHILHRRLFGLAALLGVTTRPDQEYPRGTLSELSLRFVLAHEAAHFCLGHDDRRGDSIIEFEADRLAVQSLSAALKSEVPDTAPAMALVSMRLALLATDLAERALFVRRPGTHPLAALRWETATRNLNETLCQGVMLYTDNITSAVQSASELTFRLPEVWWEQAYSSEILAADVHDDDYYRAMPHFDQLGSGDPNDPGGFLEMCEQYFGISLVGAARTAADESVYAGLVWLGISSDDAQHLCDEKSALTFYTLLQAIAQSPALKAVDEQSPALEVVAQRVSLDEALDTHTFKLTLSWCIATLIAGVMQGVYGRT